MVFRGDVEAERGVMGGGGGVPKGRRPIPCCHEVFIVGELPDASLGVSCKTDVKLSLIVSASCG